MKAKLKLQLLRIALAGVIWKSPFLKIFHFHFSEILFEDKFKARMRSMQHVLSIDKTGIFFISPSEAHIFRSAHFVSH